MKAKPKTKAAAPKVPGRQAGDPRVETHTPVAKPVLQSLAAGQAELDANPGRTKALTKDGHLVRE